MPQCTVDQLASHFRSYGWHVTQTGDFSLRTGWTSAAGHYPLHTTINATVINFEVNPLLRSTLDWKLWPELLAYLMDLNYQSSLVKLAISDAGLLSLSASVLARGFGRDNLGLILEIIGYYSDLFHGLILDQVSGLGAQRFISNSLLT